MSILGPAKQLMTLLREGQEVSPDNALPVQLSGSNGEVVAVNLSDAGFSVPAGQDKTIVVTPPPGKTWRLLTLAAVFNAPAGAAAGTHQVRFHVGDDPRFSLGRLRSKFSSSIQVQNNRVAIATDITEPTASADFMRSLTNAYFTNAMPLKIRYDNNTDVAATYYLNLRVAFWQEPTPFAP